MVNIALCHGKKHKTDALERFDPDITSSYDNWLCIDINSETNPDIIGDIRFRSTVKLLPKNNYEKIVIAYCPLFPKYQNIYLRTIKNFHKKTNASFFIVGLPYNFYNLSDEYPINDIYDILIEKISEYETPEDK